jgi:hypothetical protein
MKLNWSWMTLALAIGILIGAVGYYTFDDTDYTQEQVNTKYNEGVASGKETGFNDGYNKGWNLGYQKAVVDLTPVIHPEEEFEYTKITEDDSIDDLINYLEDKGKLMCDGIHYDTDETELDDLKDWDIYYSGKSYNKDLARVDMRVFLRFDDGTNDECFRSWQVTMNYEDGNLEKVTIHTNDE